MARQNLTEAGAKILEASTDGTLLVQVITPGWGSSGYYSAEVLQEAATEKVWGAGTHCYLDHPSASEGADRPERSVKDLAATLAEDARWDGKRLVARVTPVGLGKTVLADEAFRKAVGVSVRASAEMEIGEAEGRSGWIVEKIHPGTFNSVDIVTHAGRGGQILESARQEYERQLAEAVSDKAWSGFSQSDYDDAQWKSACLIDKGEGDGKSRYALPVKEPDGTLNRNAVHAAASRIGQVQVDAAKKKAAAKKLVSLYRNQLDEDPPESLLKAAGATESAIAETTASDTDRALRDAVSTAYANREKSTYAWVRDYDPDKGLVYFELDVDGKCTTYAQPYSVGDQGAIELSGNRVEVDQRTQYVQVGTTTESQAQSVPVHPAGQSTTTRENTMPETEGATTSIEESKRRELEEKAGRVPVLEAKLASETERADKAEQALAVEKAKTYAQEFGKTRVKEANSELEADVVDMIVGKAMTESLPLTDEGRLDTETFGTRVDDARTAEETYLARVASKRGGDVRGLGPVSEKKEVTRADSNKAVAEAFGRQVKEA
ncbi:MAG TPA: hypothetical protein VGL05_19415 [Kribbella sp.]